MSIGTAIKTERKRKGLRQEDVATQQHVSPALVGHWEKGRRPVARESLRRLVDQFDSTDFCWAAAEAVTDGVLFSIDGLSANRAEALVFAKTELRDVISVMQEALELALESPERTDQEKATEVSVEFTEGIVGLMHALGRWNTAHGISQRQVSNEARKRLSERGIVKSRSREEAARR